MHLCSMFFPKHCISELIHTIGTRSIINKGATDIDCELAYAPTRPITLCLISLADTFILPLSEIKSRIEGKL